MSAADTNPLFWEQWRQLGMAVAVRAVQDYVIARKKAIRMHKARDGCRYNFEAELGYYEKFFTGQYFGRICPDYDGHELLELLENNWQDMSVKVYHHSKQPVRKVRERHTGPDMRGKYERKKA